MSKTESGELYWNHRKQEKSTAVRIGIIGCGYWGPNLIRNFHEVAEAEVSAICDLRLDRIEPFLKKIPGVRLTTDPKKVFKDPAIEAVVIATPISTHYGLAGAALRHGKHVLVEKPLAGTVREAEALVRLARRQKKILMVGHTFEYHPAVLKINDLLKSGEIGDIQYIDSIRVNLGLYQFDNRNVVWDLVPHDIAIILGWLNAFPEKVSAWGQSFVKKGVEDVAFLRLQFPGGVLAHLHVSWLAPAKIRRMTLVGNRKMIIYDDLENVEKVKIADQGAHLSSEDPNPRINYRMGDIMSPRIPVTEPLFYECSHFVDCIMNHKKPKTDGEKGLQVVRVLEASDKSIKNHGRWVRI